MALRVSVRKVVKIIYSKIILGLLQNQWQRREINTMDRNERERERERERELCILLVRKRAVNSPFSQCLYI